MLYLPFRSLAPIILLLAILNLLLTGAVPAQAPAGQSEVIAIQAKIDRYGGSMKNRSTNQAVRGGIDSFAIAAVLSEETILYHADLLKLKATNAEAALMLLPLLTQQGLIDPATDTDVVSSPNVQYWLRGQQMTTEEFLQSGKLMVLWVKIATRTSAAVTPEAVARYVAQHPRLRVLPRRVQIELTKYIAPPMAGARGLPVHQVLTSTVSLGVRAAGAVGELPPPADWNALQLYLELETLDPTLRTVLAGKKAGDAFGPVVLKNGASVAGVVRAYLPEADLGHLPAFWQMAALRLRLEQAGTQGQFEKLVETYLKDSSPAVRGFWGKLWGGVKRGFKYITSAAGGIIGFYAGGPQGAIVGARYGYQIGSAIQGYFSQSQRESQLDYRTIPPLQPPPDWHPDHFQRYPDPANYVRRIPYYDRSGPIPAMPPDYLAGSGRRYDSWQQLPRQNCWSPPLYMGASPWY